MKDKGRRDYTLKPTTRGPTNGVQFNVLTALIERPDRLIYLSSGMHHGVTPRMDDLLSTKRAWDGASAHAESKLCDVLLAFAVARRWRNVLSNALEPGWVPTKMGGPSAPGDMSKAHLTHAWLAVSDDPLAREPENISTTSNFGRRTRSRVTRRDGLADLSNRRGSALHQAARVAYAQSGGKDRRPEKRLAGLHCNA